MTNPLWSLYERLTNGEYVFSTERSQVAMMRQIGKQILTIAAAAAVVVAAALPAAAGTTTSGIVVDPLSGVAIDGYDPITYFTDLEPSPGKPDFEYVWGGVPWYFASEANRDVFRRAPEVYAPQHGGHCQMSLARGYLSDGKPRIFAIYGAKLYLFYSLDNRDAFLVAPAATIEAAESNWDGLVKELPAN